MDRKEFLVTTSMAAFALSAFGFTTKTESGAFKGDCETTNDILGPFYRADSPERSDLTFEGLEGNVINIRGTVFGSDCVSPLNSTLVEIWHCDINGNYDNDSDKYLHRGSFVTSVNGEFNFKTIIPGKYLNGKLYRPSHIHFRVTEKRSKELVSQIYFAGDPHIEKDPWASKPKAEHRILPIEPHNINGGLTITFDIFLADK